MDFESAGETPLQRSSSKQYLDPADKYLAGESSIPRSRSKGDLDPDAIREEISALMESDALEILRKQGPLKNFEAVELLHLAAGEGRTQRIQLLFQRVGLDNLLNAKGKSWPSWTALHYGAANNHEGVLKLLLEKPEIKVDTIDSKGNTALLIASGRGHTAAVKILLQQRAATHIWNNSGRNCLTAAASKGHVDVVKALMDFLKDHKGSTIDEIQVGAGFRLSELSDSTSPKWTALHHASAHSLVEVLKVLLENPHIGTVDVQAGDGSTALVVASERGNEDVVKMLLENKADPLLSNSKGWNSLHAAAFEGKDKVVKMLLDDSRFRQGINFQDKNGNTALMLACQKGHKLVVGILMLFSADVRVKNHEGSTCLHMAADGNHHAVIQSILRLPMHKPQENRKQFINDPDGVSGNTALIIVSEKGNAEAVRMLLSAGADPLICNKNEFSCIHVASKEGHSAVLKLLLGEVENPGAVESVGQEMAPLVLATSKARSREIAIMKVMGKRVNNTQLPAELTALHLAAQGRHLSVILQLLKAYLALVLKVHGFARQLRDQPLMLQFFHLIRFEVSNRYKRSNEQPSSDSLQAGGSMNPPANTDPMKSKNQVHDSGIEDWIPKSEGHDEIRKALMLYWTSLESNQDAKDWKKVILENFHVNPGGEEYFVEKLVDAYMRLVDYSNSKDSSGRTFFHYIADQELSDGHDTESCASTECLIRRILEEVSVDVNAPDSKGDTPLHLAMRQGNRCVFRHCLVPGRVLNLDTKNGEGNSVLDLAFRNSILEPEEPRSIKLDPNLDPFKELERDLIKKFIDARSARPTTSSSHDTYTATISEETLCLLLRSMKERVNCGQVAPTGSSGVNHPQARLIKTFRDEHHYDGLTLLHYAAFRGLNEDLKSLLEIYSRLVNRPCKIHKWTPLHYAVHGGHKEVVDVLLREESKARTIEKDKWGETPLGIAITRKAEFHKREHSKFHVFKDIEQRLLKDSDVFAYNKKLLSDRQVLGDASNAILVGAAVIASVTFAGWLQPPLGYVDYHLFSDQSPPPGSTESFVAIAQYKSVQVFWVFNSLSFFFAVATVICGAGAVVQATSASSYYIRNEVRLMRIWLRTTSTLLAISIICVLGAFAAAGFAVLPPSAKYRTSMIVTASLGIPTCVICLLCLFSSSRILGEGVSLFTELSSAFSNTSFARIPVLKYLSTNLRTSKLSTVGR